MSQSDDLTEIKVAIGVLKEQNSQIMKQQTVMSTKQESMSQQIATLSFVKQKEFDDFKAEVRNTYATKDEISPMKKFFYSALSAVAVALVSFWVWITQRGGQ